MSRRRISAGSARWWLPDRPHLTERGRSIHPHGGQFIAPDTARVDTEHVFPLPMNTAQRRPVPEDDALSERPATGHLEPRQLAFGLRTGWPLGIKHQPPARGAE